MADSSSNATNAGSHFLPTVTLFDWWLVKSPDNRLCISGNASRKGEAVRVFNSSPIVERYDVYSLKNAEGIYIFIRGIINEERTLEKGFTPQIFNSFYIGFPPNWETCWVLHCIREEEEEVETGTDLVNAAMNTESPICEDILSDDEQKSISVLLELPEEAPENNQTPFPGDECQVSKETSGVNVACGGGVIKRSTRLHSINVCQQKKIEKQQPTSRGPLKHPDGEPSSTSKAVENRDSDTAHLDNVSANLPEISSGAVENSFPTSSVTPEKATGHCNKLFPEGEEDMSIKTSEANVVHGSGRNRRSARLHNVKSFQKKQPATGGPATRRGKNRISASAAIEKSDGGLENLSTSVQSQSGIVNTLSGQVSNKIISKTSSAKTEVGHKKKKVTVETEKSDGGLENLSTPVQSQSGIVNTLSGQVTNKFRSKISKTSAKTEVGHKKKKVTVETEKSDGGLENLSTPVQSQSGIVNTLSGKVTNKFRSKISKTSSANTEVGHKKKKVTVETEAVNHKRKVMKPPSSVKSPQGRDVTHLNKGSKQELTMVSPESLSLKKSRSGRLLLPSMEFWRNEIPIYNADRGIKEIQQDLTLTSPFRGFSPSPFRGFSPSPGRF
ncbi:kinetochore-associated protein KNL-2 homolog isoform X2 [Vicia villosa]|uniref:kinetochore-associated protein KNL-2 homolog isoform X2 n=1 Tax=Vicia villosa TaxID=3911 RepID=UPI00273B5148|nr:kinetochore-associated protein KNL-2 homolog isoform X2 [Vicia villosa]